MKADTVVTSGAVPMVVANPPVDYLKPVLAGKSNPTQGLPPPPPQGPPGGGPLPPGPELAIAVECGPNKAWFYVGRLCQGSKGPCVLFNGAWLTPNEFQYVSGRETAKDWKRSIRHHGKSMKLLITKGILAISPPNCQCDVCLGVAENNNNLDVNKRAAEIAARKAAAEAAALAEAAGKIVSPVKETSGSVMADTAVSAGAEDRQVDLEAGGDQNSPAKESRLTNIIEAIKSKKKRDPSDMTGDSVSPGENGPCSPPPSPEEKSTTKDIPVMNGTSRSSSPDQSPCHRASSPKHQSNPSTKLNASVPLATSVIPNSSSSTDLTPKLPDSLPPNISLSSETSPSTNAAATSKLILPITSETIPSSIPAESLPSTTPSDSSAQTEMSSGEHSDDSGDEAKNEAVESEDVSRTRAFNWDAWKQKKLEAHQKQLKRLSIYSNSILDKQKTENNNNNYNHKFPDPYSTLTNNDDEGKYGKVGTLVSNHVWTPSVQVSQSVPPVSVGQDTKPPLLSASRSITTATASITKPIVSIGSGAFSSTVPKEQRDGSTKDGGGREEASKVYAPINWPPVATEVSSKEAKIPSSESPNKEARNSIDSSSSRDAKMNTTSTTSSSSSSETHEKALPTLHPHTPPTLSPEERRRPSEDHNKRPPSPRKEMPRPEMPAPSSNYSEYLRQLGRVPPVPPPGVDDESYVALMRRYYEWYEMARLYSPYGVPSAGHPQAGTPVSPALQRPTIPHPSPPGPPPYDPHSLLASMYHPYYYHHHQAAATASAAGGDPYRSLPSSIPPEWARLGALGEHEREALIARQREQEKEAVSAGGSPHSLKRPYPGEEALDLSVNKKQKLAESLAVAREGALLYGLPPGFRQPSLPMMGLHGAPMAAGYPQGYGSLELAAAYPGLWRMPHSHPGASLSHPLPNSMAAISHPGMSFQHPLSGVALPATSVGAVTSSGSPHKDLLQATHSQSQALGLAGAWR